jgi:excisionase family DNA binding protein
VLPSPEIQPTVTVEEAGDALGISRASAYEGVRNGEIPSIRIGRRVVVPVAALRRLLELDAPNGAA